MGQLNISLDDMTVRAEPGTLSRVKVAGTRAEIRTACAWAELTAVADGIVHVVWHPGEHWQNEPTRYVTPPRRANAPPWRLRRTRRRLTAGSAGVVFDTDPVRLQYTDDNGTFLAESSRGPFGYLHPGVAVTWNISRTERIYGLGQNAFADIDRTGCVRTMAADHLGGAGGDIPISFWVSTRGYGVVVDNPNIASFDLRRKGQITFSARDGYINYFVLWGPTIPDVLRRYADLTGRPPLPPRWLFGPSFCRTPGGNVPGYRSDRELVALARKLRARDIPADGLILDFQWEQRIGGLTWHRKHFSRSRWMLRELDKLGFQTIVILKPAVNLAAETAARARSDGLALTRTDGTVHTGNFHQGRSLFLDFFNPATRRWYVQHLRRLLDEGVAGWWTDEGDWIGYLSPSVRELARGRDAMRNLYNNTWCETIYDGQRRHCDKRIVNITRTGRVGIQRYGTSIWSGDVDPTWQGLASQVQMGLNAGLSGIPFWTTDGGGFLGTPTRELYVRWAQFAVFCPLTRFHGCSPREPWHFGPKAEAAVRDVLQWRMRLIPYVYAAAWQAHTQGLPMMRAMAVVEPADRRFANLSSQYFFGDSLLVRPVTAPLSQIRKRGNTLRTELTPGRWFDFWTGRSTGSGGRVNHVTAEPVLHRIPVYVRAPAVVVLADPGATTREPSWDTLTARVYIGDMNGPWQTAFELYEDDATTYAYEKGAVLLTRLTAKRKTERSFAFTIAPKGKRMKPIPARRKWRLELFGLTRQPTLRANGRALPARQKGACWTAELPFGNTSARQRVTITW
ncbi:MAG: glycoside hydrolase family 31 protein [Phycisphaerales bacterium]|nr:MAG: glycoside hydrolase family 31 protein [Phycisphaerales bacterium]